jgi:hypothetical protein
MGVVVMTRTVEVKAATVRGLLSQEPIYRADDWARPVEPSPICPMIWFAGP